MHTTWIPLVTVLLTTITTATATAEDDLEIGDPAPPLEVSHWIRGEPVGITDDGTGPIIVLDFWAVHCGPCIRGIPELTDLQARYGPDRVRIVGISEDSRFNSLDRVRHYVDRRGDEMGYTVAYDGGGRMWKRYMEAAGERGIPTSFVITPDGRVAWIGHPEASVGRVLARLDAGTHDLEFEAASRRMRHEEERAWRASDAETVDAMGDRVIEYDRARALGWINKVSAAAMMADDQPRARAIVRDGIAALRDHPWELQRFLMHGVLHPRMPRGFGPTLIDALGPVIDRTDVHGMVRVAAMLAVLEAEPPEAQLTAARRLAATLPVEGPSLHTFALFMNVQSPRERFHPIAVEAVDRAVAARPRSFERARARYLIVSTAGDDDATADAAGDCVTLLRDDPEATSTFVWSMVTEHESGPRTLEVARRAAEHMCAIAPADADRLDTLARVRFRTGDLAGAVAAQQRAVELAVGDASTYRSHLEEYRTAYAAAAGEG